jgi:hypothetical protein
MACSDHASALLSREAQRLDSKTRHGKLPHAQLKGLRLSAASFLPFQFLPDELLGLDIERSFSAIFMRCDVSSIISV